MGEGGEGGVQVVAENFKKIKPAPNYRNFFLAPSYKMVRFFAPTLVALNPDILGKREFRVICG